jgi:TetR/AcrR family transcriptional repressor of nem operon
LERTADPIEQLRRYAKLYGDVLVDDRMCLCGMFAAEFSTLPETMQNELRIFFDANERWLTGVLDAGRRAGTMRFNESPKERARLLLGALEGAMLVARTYGDAGRFRAIARNMLAQLSDGATAR